MNFVLHEPDVAITDWLLFFECIAFAWFLWKQKHILLARQSTFIFLAFAASSLLGGLYHGFFPERTATQGGFIIWIATMLTIGLGAVMLIHAAMTLAKKSSQYIANASYILFIAFACYVIFVDHRFIIAILVYLPAIFLLLLSFIQELLQTKNFTFLYGIFGVVLSLAASALQQLQVGIHPYYFNYNALYHLLQAIALLLLFVAFRGAVVSRFTRNK